MSIKQKQNSLEHSRKILRAFLENGYDAKFAGGCVRDRLLGESPHDFDIATNALPSEVVKLAKRIGWKAIPTGIQHGTITLVHDDLSWEVTTLRKDISTDGRHAEVEFCGTSFEDDAKRRDFTINAMFEDVEGKIFDYFGGQVDLKNGLVKFVGNPEDRIKEDYLRILRFYRFQAKLNFSPEKNSESACIKLKSGLKNLSMERVNSELMGILSAPYPAEVLLSLSNSGLLKEIFLDFITLNNEEAEYVQKTSKMTDPEGRKWSFLTILLGLLSNKPTRELSEKLAKDLKWSIKEKNTLLALVDGWQSILSVGSKTSEKMRFLDGICLKVPQVHNLDLFSDVWLNLSKISKDSARSEQFLKIFKLEQEQHNLRMSPLPVDGNDVLLYRKDLAGPQIARALELLKDGYRDGVWSEKEHGLKYLESLKL